VGRRRIGEISGAILKIGPSGIRTELDRPISDRVRNSTKILTTTCPEKPGVMTMGICTGLDGGVYSNECRSTCYNLIVVGLYILFATFYSVM